MLIQYTIQLSPSRRNVLYMMNVKMRAVPRYIGDEVVMSDCNERELQEVRFIKDSIDEHNLEGSPGS